MRAILFILAITLLEPAWGRWESMEEASFVENFERLRYQVESDGSYRFIKERQLEILKENARDLGLTRIHSSESEDFDLDEAYTLNADKKISVPSSQIEIKPLASRGQGFDNDRQVTIGYPKVSVGSKLFYRYELSSKKPRIPGLFYTHFNLGRNYQQEFEISLESEVPLYWETHDPESFLEVESKEEKGKYRLSIKLKRPIYRKAIEEEDSLPDPQSLVWVAISTARDWASLPRHTPLAYEKVMQSPLPPLFEQIRAAAALHKNPIDQINTVTSRLAAAVRYVGDWATVEGAYHPRTMETVATTGYGDCKDFTSVTGAILSRLGYEVNAAWVLRSFFPSTSPLRTVAAPYINHAILHARKDGRDFWLDPTNFTSFAQGIYPDIAGRPALVLFAGKPELRDIPELKPEDSESRLDIEITATRSDKITGRGNYSLLKRASLYAAGKGISLSQARLQYAILDWIMNPKDLVSWKMPEVSLSSRIVSDFSTTFEFEENWRPTQTSAGKGYALYRSPHVGSFQISRKDRVSLLKLYAPGQYHREYIVRGRPIVQNRAVKCGAQSAWLDFSRHIRRANDGVKVTEKVVLKRSLISPAEIRSEEFGRLQRKINECMHTAVVVFQ